MKRVILAVLLLAGIACASMLEFADGAADVFEKWTDVLSDDEEEEE